MRRRAPLRSPAEIAVMRRAGRVVAEMHEVCRAAIRPGTTTGELDALAREVLERRGATSNFLGYGGFPGVLCASVNDEVVHGIPGDRRLEEGDLVSIDCGAVVDGWHGDAAFTASVGTPAPGDDALSEAARRSLDAAIDQVRPGRTLGDVGHAVESVVAAAGFTLLEDHCGHGIGRAMHEAPDVLNTGRPGRGLTLEVGMVLAIEPMVCAGRADYRVLDDGWTVVTADGRRGAHWEHTVAVTADGPEVLTLA
ncbi:MAG TPA: type I methionyl aminopeptidase [Acidimicrobiales bacterium]|nr:type I methionyl aminopeptidase [Acidimicrobiales bacterium]